MTDPGLSAGDAARRLGIAVTTLRTWHQRYGIGPADYRAGEHRRYRSGDMDRLEAMQRLTNAGVSPADAARTVLASGDEGPPTGGRHGGGTVIPLGRVNAAARGLATAAIHLDAAAMADLIATSITGHGVIVTWNAMIRPVLQGLARRQGDGTDLIDVEHLLSRTVTRAFGAVDAPAHAHAHRTILACADGEHHTLALDAVAAALAEAGTGCRHFGARVPPHALADAVRRSGPAVVVIWSQTSQTGDPDQLTRLLEIRLRPDVLMAAGPGWWTETIPATVVRPRSLSETVKRILATVRTT